MSERFISYAREQEEADGAILRSSRTDGTIDDERKQAPDPRRPRGKRRWRAPLSPITPRSE